MADHTMATTTARANGAAHRPGLRAGLLAPWRGLALLGTGLLAALVSWLLLVAMSLTLLWVGFALVPVLAQALRSLADRQLTLGHRWSGVPHAASRTAAEEADGIGTAAGAAPAERSGAKGIPASWRRTLRLLGRASTWRDVAWAHAAVTVTGLLALLPFALLAHGVFGLVLPFVWEPVVSAWDGSWYLFVPLNDLTTARIAAGLGVLEIVATLWAGPYLLRAQARISRSLLAR